MCETGFPKTLIRDIRAREVLDSRGNPTVEAIVCAERGTKTFVGSAMVPSGASTGQFEAFEKRDSRSTRYHGKGVEGAVVSVNTELASALKGMDVTAQKAIDRKMCELDGSPNKSRLGANAILAVSIAAAKCAARSVKLPLYRYIGGMDAFRMPVPMMNILNGGVHAANNLDIQEFMIMPVGASSFREALRMCSEVYHQLRHDLHSKGLSTTIGDEGGFAPNLRSAEEAIKLMLDAIDGAGYTSGPTGDFMLALDAASTEWYSDNAYLLPKARKTQTPKQLITYWKTLCSKYPIFSLEDGAAEDDWTSWQSLTAAIGGRVQLVGDDLFVTNRTRLEQGIKTDAANAILVKFNQIGTLSETLDAVETAHRAGYAAVMSHRSGETEDTTIADLAVALGTGQIKTGAPCRSDRTAKYNRLLAIEEALGPDAVYLCPEKLFSH